MCDLADRLDELHATTRTPVTARRPWLQAWLDSYRSFDPLTVGLERPDGRLDAIALLATKRQRGLTQVVAVGHGPSDAMTLPARDAVAGGALSEAVAAALHGQRGAWQLSLRHLSAEDALAPHLLDDLRRSRLAPGDVSPTLRTEPGDVLAQHVSRSHHQGISRIRNRMVRDGLRPTIEHLYDADRIAAVLPAVEQVFRRREAAMERACALDRPEPRDFFRHVIAQHAALGTACLTTLSLEGELAAYVLCFVDGPAYRMWHPRFDPRWDRYSPGKLAMDESIAHALSQGATEYDFMRGQERYKSSYANHLPRALDLFAASGPVVGVATSTALSLRTRMREAAEGGGRPGRAVEWTRRMRSRHA